MLGASALTLSLLAAPAEAGPRKTRVSATLSATATNPGGAVDDVRLGQGQGEAEAQVVLEQKIASGWRTVGKTRSAKDGAYAFAVPTTWFYSTKLRARVKPTRKHRGSASRAHRLSVVPAYTPARVARLVGTLGRSRDRWNPCRTLTYGINTSRATPDAATVSTGIHNTIALVVAGDRRDGSSSRARPARTRSTGSGSASDPDIIFGWTTDAETKLDLGPSYAARGGYDRTRRARDARGKLIWEALDGGVVYDLTDTATMNATEFQQLTLHEVGHVDGARATCRRSTST